METVQFIYYILGIITYIMWILLLGVSTYAIWQIYQKVKDTPEELKMKVSELFSSKKMEMASMAGMFMSTLILNKLKNKIFGKK